jgi:hypothetical protein
MGSLTFTNWGFGRKTKQIFLAQQQKILTAPKSGSQPEASTKAKFPYHVTIK